MIARAMELAGFYFAHPQMFVVPVEHQTDDGLTEEFAAELLRRGLVDGEWIALLSRALVTYRARAADLFARARDSWFPPRRQNVCMITEPDTTRPYYQPFDRACWPLYLSDFDPRTSSPEHATFQIAHAERLGLTRHIGRALLSGLSWFLVRTREELEDFADGCARSTRPDAEAFRALADALPWIGELRHDPLAPARPDERDLLALEKLLVPEPLAPRLLALGQRFEAETQRVVEAHRAAQALPNALVPPQLRVWLEDVRPHLVLVDAAGQTLWDPERGAGGALDDALRDATDRALESLRADLDAVGEHSTRVLAALRDPDALPRTASEVEADGGVWLDAKRRAITFSLAQPGLDVLHEAAPPFHRLLLVARTVHEWGHLAADAGIVRLDPSRVAEHDAASDELAAIFTAIASEAPAAARTSAEREHGVEGHDALGRALLRTATSRMGDWHANVFARRFLPLEAMEAYVRANVRTLAHERTTSLLTRLARHTYEVQYLSLSRMRDANDYFFASTWFDASFVDTKVVTRAQAIAAFAAMARICACHTLDEAALR
jgi:hypothetical protein